MARRLLAVVAALAVCALIGPNSLTLSSNVQASPTQTQVAEGELIVKFRERVAPQQKTAVHSRANAQPDRQISGLAIDVVQVEPGREQEALAEYRNDRNVEYAEINGTYRAIGTTNDASVALQWQYNNTGQTGGSIDADIDAFEAWEVTTGSGITIAILDTGIDQSHEDLAGKIVANANFSSSNTVDDFYGHGTHVAGSAAADSNNTVGVAGACPDCRLMNVKVLGDDGTGNWADVAEGIVWATDNGADVINMSIGDTLISSAVEDAVNYAWANGVVVVAAAGNDGQSTEFYPAAYDNAIAVAATTHNDAKAGFSQFGSWVDVAAPGENIFSTAPDHFSLLFFFPANYGTLSGTSMASPHVAGIAGLVLSSGACGDNACVRSRIESRAEPIAGTGEFWQYGRVNAYHSVVSGSVPAPEPIVTGLNPAIGLPEGGTSVTVSGLRFDTAPGATTIDFGGQPATEVTCDTSESCTATSPAGTGVVHVTATVGGTTSTTSFADFYTYGSPPCSAVDMTATPVPPQAPGTSVQFDAAAEGCADPEYRFWLRDLSGQWQIVQDWSPSASWTWDTTGLTAGAYLVSVWTRAAGSTADYEAFFEVPFDLAVTACSSVDVSATPSSPQVPGSSVQVDAVAQSCGSAEYRFWLRDTSNQWQIVQDWSSDPTWNWDTTGLSTGAYLISVWTRAAGSAAAYEAFSEVPYDLAISACSSVDVETSPASPQAPGSSVEFSAAAQGCESPEYLFWLRDTGGQWQLVQNWSNNPSWTWDTTASATGSYLVSVWSRASGSTAAYEAYSEVPYNLAISACSSVDVDATPASPQAPGSSVQFDATADGCGSPEYRFWLRNPNNEWQIVQDWSNNASWTWDTTGLTAGSYLVSVWSRATGSTAAYEAYSELPYDLAVTACSSVDVDATPASPQAPGASVEFDAAAQGCGSAEYRFWLRNPNNQWQIVQDWSANASWTWDTTSLTAGSYLVSVWSRATGSTATYEAFAEVPYDLAVTACSSVDVDATPASPQTPGTSVEFDAAAQGCSSPEYRFWLRDANNQWQIVQDWSSNASWTWDTTGMPAGSYLVSVWSRASGSSATYEAYLEVLFDLE